jgi:hypothetical protein
MYELKAGDFIYSKLKGENRMNQEIFADTVSAIHVTGNLVRIDFMTRQPQLKSENGQPVFDISKRVIMPIEGFIQFFAIQENIVNQLVNAGVLTKNQNPGGGVVPTHQPQDEEKEG